MTLPPIPTMPYVLTVPQPLNLFLGMRLGKVRVPFLAILNEGEQRRVDSFVLAN